MRRFAIAVGGVVALTGAALASPAMTIVTTQMRNSPDSRAEIVQTIPANAQIDVTGCGKIWCSASWRDLPGFVRVSAISGERGAPPLVYSDYPPPPPATVFIAPPLVVAPFGCCWGGGGYYRRW